jgi:hypothetical protein
LVSLHRSRTFPATGKSIGVFIDKSNYGNPENFIDTDNAQRALHYSVIATNVHAGIATFTVANTGDYAICLGNHIWPNGIASNVRVALNSYDESGNRFGASPRLDIESIVRPGEELDVHVEIDLFEAKSDFIGIELVNEGRKWIPPTTINANSVARITGSKRWARWHLDADRHGFSPLSLGVPHGLQIDKSQWKIEALTKEGDDTINSITFVPNNNRHMVKAGLYTIYLEIDWETEGEAKITAGTHLQKTQHLITGSDRKAEAAISLELTRPGNFYLRVDSKSRIKIRRIIIQKEE